MTCREKLREMHPEWTEEDLVRQYRISCPHDHGIMDDPEWCIANSSLCEGCWDRTVSCIKKTMADVVENLQKHGVRIPSQTNEETEPTILDSGDRTEFASGARRDMRAGKGRFDISPLEVMADLIGNTDSRYDPILFALAQFLKLDDTSWLYVALTNFSEKAYGGCVTTMLLEVAKHFEEGAKKYGEANYRKGIPVWCYIDSAARHYIKWLRGDNEEPHNRAVVWNLLCCIWEVDYGDEWRAAQKAKEAT